MTNSKGTSGLDSREKLYLSSWVCDFSNVIVGSTQKKTLKFKNAGDYLIEMAFDTKVIKGT